LLEKSPLLNEYLILRMSFEGIGDTYFDNEPKFVARFNIFVYAVACVLLYLSCSCQ